MTIACPKKFASTLPYSRFRKYLSAAKKRSSNSSDDEIEFAVRLYAWNTALSAAFYEPLQALEITLRNAVHGQMTHALNDETWYNNLPTKKLNQDKIRISLSKIKKVREKLKSERKNLKKRIEALEAAEQKEKELEKRKKEQEKKKTKSYTIDYMVSNLDLGFWVNLFNHDYLWNEGLKKVFPHKDLPRGEAYDRLKKLNTLRNRIAHHEPIFHRNLQRDRADILETLGWICPTTKAWVKDHERMRDVIKMRPKK